MGQVKESTEPGAVPFWGGIAQAVYGVQSSYIQMMNPLNQVSGLINLPSTVQSAYQEGGIGLGVNQFNPVFHLLTNASNGWDLAQNGCVAESASALTSATFDAASVAGVAAGALGSSRAISRLDWGSDLGEVNFFASADGVVVPTSRNRLIAGFTEAGLPSTSTTAAGVQYALPDGSLVRVMEPSGQAVLRASFTNANGGPISPFTGKPVQPPPGMSKADRLDYIRKRTHINLGK